MNVTFNKDQKYFTINKNNEEVYFSTTTSVNGFNIVVFTDCEYKEINDIVSSDNPDKAVKLFNLNYNLKVKLEK